MDGDDLAAGRTGRVGRGSANLVGVAAPGDGRPIRRRYCAPHHRRRAGRDGGHGRRPVPAAAAGRCAGGGADAMTRIVNGFVWCGLIATLAGCAAESAVPPAPVRPVLSVVVTPRTGRSLGFAGTVEPRYRASLGFKVLGRIIARDANVGDVVKQGARLAAIDPLALQFAVRAAEADLASARAQFANAEAVEGRQRTLRQQGAATDATLDAAQQARDAGAAGVARAEAALAKAQEQLRDAELRADFDGVITAVDAEIGQVVSPGQSVLTLARPDVREAVVDIPDDA